MTEAMEAVKSSIQEVLCSISEEDASSVAEHLCDEVGVESLEDLALVEPDDLPMLKKMQVRKLIQRWKKKPETELSESGEEPLSCSSSATSCSSGASPSPNRDESTSSGNGHLLAQQSNWSRQYVIPWKKMSKTLNSCLEKGSRPLPSQRREMIRILVDDIQRVVTKPSKQQLTFIAEKMVTTYPSSLKDVIGNQTIGTGYDSLLKNILQRVYNQNRGGAEVSKRRNVTGTGPQPPKQKKLDQYGCVNFFPTELPDGETMASLKEAQNQMKVASGLGSEYEDVSDKMRLTYFLQRRDIASENYTMVELQKDWPYLFAERGLFDHFKELVGFDVLETLQTAFETKGKKVLDFMQDCGKQQLQSTLISLARTKAELQNNSPEIPALVMLLMKYFGEKQESLFPVVLEPTSTKEDVPSAQRLPPTPVLIPCGEILSARRWMLAIDGHLVADHIPTFLKALGMLFSSYYCFGIEYSSDSAATLDFIQRCLLMINPERGSKVKRGYGTNPKVLTLIKNISDYEWTV